MLLLFASAPIGDLGTLLISLLNIDSYHMICRMGFARLAETSIRKIKGKTETESLGAFDKILASTIGGALATWNQPIEVVRVEVSILDISVWNILNIFSYILDAINGQKHRQCQPTSETHHHEYSCLYL